MPANPQLYREMSVPFESQADAEKAAEAFFEDLTEIRKKHRIRDVSCVLQLAVKVPPVMLEPDLPTEGDVMTICHVGDELKQEGMLAWAYGYAASERSNRITEQVARHGKKSPKKSS